MKLLWAACRRNDTGDHPTMGSYGHGVRMTPRAVTLVGQRTSAPRPGVSAYLDNGDILLALQPRFEAAVLDEDMDAVFVDARLASDMPEAE